MSDKGEPFLPADTGLFRREDRVEVKKSWVSSPHVPPPQPPRPIGISSYAYNGRTTEVLYDNGTVWRYVADHPFKWTRLPPIPQGDA